MRRCRSCSLARIYKQFEEKAKKETQAAKETALGVIATEIPVVSIIDKSQPTKTKKKRASKKEKTEEVIEEIKEDVVEETPSEEIIDAE